MSEMKRRAFITLLGGTAVAWPLAAGAQQKEHVRRVGVLMHTSAGEPETQARLAAFVQGLQEAGWFVGRNVQVQVETRWSTGDLARLSRMRRSWWKRARTLSYRVFVVNGGLLTYSTDISNQYRRAASCVDRILKGEKPGELPVQSPTKYDLVINLKTAKTLGLTVPPTLIARADDVIE